MQAIKRSTRFTALALLIAMGIPAMAQAQRNSNGIDLTPKGDWACEVVMCLASPNSPTEFAECVPPIEKLYKELAKGASFPRCGMGGAESGNYAQQRGNCIDVYIDGRLHNTVNWKTPGAACTAPGGGGGLPGRPTEPRAPEFQH